MEFIERLRKQPVAVRQRITLFATVVISLIIGTIWVVTFNTDTGTTMSISDVISPFRVVIDTSKSAIGSVKTQFGNMKATLEQGSAREATDTMSVYDEAATSTEPISNITYLKQLSASVINASTTHETR